MEKHTLIAPVGENIDLLFRAITLFSFEKAILIVPKQKLALAESTKKELARLGVPAHIKPIEGNIWEELFRVITEIAQYEKSKLLVINVSSGDQSMQCAATSAAFVNGIKAFTVENGEPMLLPVLKFSYYTQLTEKKMQILKLLYNDPTCCMSMEQLSKRLKMSLPLLSYHINGNLKSEGLHEHGLIETTETKGKVAISLTMLGKLLIKGYIT